MRLTSAFTTAVLVTGLAVAAATPAAGESQCVEDEVLDPETNTATTVYTCPGDSSGGGGSAEAPDTTPVAGGGGGGGGERVTCTRTAYPHDRISEAPEQIFNWWRSYEDRGEEIWGLAFLTCSDGSERSPWICFADCTEDENRSEDEPDWEAQLQDLLIRAAARVDLPGVDVRHTFDQPAANGNIRAVAMAETWWWTESWGEITVADADGPVWVEVRATPRQLTVDPGDGSAVLVCDGPGVAYNRHRPYDEQAGHPNACAHVYEVTSHAMTATARVGWDITYRGGTPRGELSGTLSNPTVTDTATFPVVEIQSVVSAG